MVPRRTATIEAEPAASGSPIRVAARRTGIPEETLRAWERRYGFPAPQRRAGGSRLYSEADILKLQKLAEAIQAGFRPGDVVGLSVHELDQTVARSRQEAGQRAARVVVPPTDDIVELVLSALRRDDAAAVRSIVQALATQLGPADFVTQLAHPLVVQVGEAWAAGALDVRHEHLATAFLQTQLRAMLAAYQEPVRAKVVVLTTLPDEPHALPLDLVAVYLTSLELAPRLLGPSTPIDQIAAAASALHADAVGISVSSVAPKATSRRHLRALRAALPTKTTLWLGGSGAAAVAPKGRGVLTVEEWSELDHAARALERVT